MAAIEPQRWRARLFPIDTRAAAAVNAYDQSLRESTLVDWRRSHNTTVKEYADRVSNLVLAAQRHCMVHFFVSCFHLLVFLFLVEGSFLSLGNQVQWHVCCLYVSRASTELSNALSMRYVVCEVAILQVYITDCLDGHRVSQALNTRSRVGRPPERSYGSVCDFISFCL